MAASFPRFNELPTEIRYMIWNKAIRPDCPGAHVFGARDVGCPEEHSNESHVVIESVPLGMSLDCYRVWMAAPRCLPKTLDDSITVKNLPGSEQEEPEPAGQHSPSWTRNNWSAYLIDEGLWAACKESRLIMERAFKTGFIYRADLLRCERHNRRNLCIRGHQNANLRAARGYDFTHEGSANHLFTFSTQRDLFVLQPHLFRISGIWDLRFLFRTRDASPVQNLACEFDPAWGDLEVFKDASIYPCLASCSFDGDLDDPCSLPVANVVGIMRSHALRSVRKFWFIDYKLMRKHHVPTKEQAANEGRRAVFTASDRRFIEVDHTRRGGNEFGGDGSDEPWGDGYEPKDIEDFVPSSLWFAWLVEKALRKDGDERGRKGPDIGVLACEFF